jgi:hypothetical protein
MLTINKKNFNIKKKNINVSACTYNPETEEVVVILDGEHSVPNNKNIKLFRNLVDGDVFSENFITKSSVVSNGKTYVTIDYKLTDYLLYPSDIEKNVTIETIEGEDFTTSVLMFNNIKHIFTEDINLITIDYFLNSGETENNICDGHLLFENKFLYETKNGVINENYYNIEDILLNINGKNVKVILIPFSVNGYYDRTKIFVEGELEGVDLTNIFSTNDSRFFIIWSENELKKNIEYVAHKNTVLQLSEETLNLNIGIGRDFNTDLQHDILISDYINEIKGKYASTPQDFEKAMFIPYINGEPKSLTFNIFLRQRHFFEDEMEWKLSSYNNSTNTWEYDENAMWNSYIYDGTIGRYTYSGLTKDTGDLLGDLGFDDNDVLNQNKRLGKTFIRLLFFDSKDRGTQTLLFYSTMFINTTDMYSKLMKNITSHQKEKLENDQQKQINEDYVSIVNNKNQDLQLTCSFTCYDKNNMTHSTEGFYVYLFPSLVDKLKDENGISRIYMRVEFNHAKYGKTIPLVFRNEPLVNYTKTSSGFIGTDLLNLYDDMYIPIELKNVNGKYFWCFSYNGEDEYNPVFSLWEPKIR